jgi:hypothetical protein
LTTHGASALDALQAQMEVISPPARNKVLENLRFMHLISDK